jgi:hypothetical protein
MTVEECFKLIDEHLGKSHQTWLLGAGISKEAGIPLMPQLTNYVEEQLQDENQARYKSIRSVLVSSAHVENILNHIVNLIAIAEDTRIKTAEIAGGAASVGQLRSLHKDIQKAISEIVRWGCKNEPGAPVTFGTKDAPLATIDSHVNFVKALFSKRRLHQESLPPVTFFTTNYDTLLEDAFALNRVDYLDGFTGGGMAFWNPEAYGGYYKKPFERYESVAAKLYKLHGSIDWFEDHEDVVVRLRDSCRYPSRERGHHVIYPAASKYAAVRREPFSTAFAALRDALSTQVQGLIAVCGYSFGDEHVTDEIVRALQRRGNAMTLLVFANQPDGDMDANQNLPGPLAALLGGTKIPWSKRVFVCGRRGFYHGTLENKCTTSGADTHPWWTFSGVTKLIEEGRVTDQSNV